MGSNYGAESSEFAAEHSQQAQFVVYFTRPLNNAYMKQDPSVFPVSKG